MDWICPIRVYQACPTGTPGQTQEPLALCYILQLAWAHLGIPQENLESVARDREVWKDLRSRKS